MSFLLIKAKAWVVFYLENCQYSLLSFSKFFCVQIDVFQMWLNTTFATTAARISTRAEQTVASRMFLKCAVEPLVGPLLSTRMAVIQAWYGAAGLRGLWWDPGVSHSTPLHSPLMQDVPLLTLLFNPTTHFWGTANAEWCEVGWRWSLGSWIILL